MDDSTPFSGLGQRAGAVSAPPPEAAPAEDNEPDSSARASIQRTVPAASAPAPQVDTSPFTSWLRPGQKPPLVDLDAEDEPAPAPAAAPITTTPSTEEKKPMATTAKKKARPGRAPGPKKQPTRDEHPQLKICMHLASKPEQLLDRAELFGLLEADGLRRQQCYGALNTAKKAKRVRREGGAYRLTPGGLKWLQEQQQELGLEVTPATGKPPRAKPGRRVATPAAATAEFASKTTALAQRPFEPVVERSFRWGVFNDGALHLVKDGSSIELTEAEAGELLRGYGRMAQAAA